MYPLVGRFWYMNTVGLVHLVSASYTILVIEFLRCSTARVPVRYQDVLSLTAPSSVVSSLTVERHAVRLGAKRAAGMDATATMAAAPMASRIRAPRRWGLPASSNEVCRNKGSIERSVREMAPTPAIKVPELQNIPIAHACANSQSTHGMKIGRMNVVGM